MSREFPVVFALYPQVTQLDFTGPYEIFARLPQAHCVLASVGGGTIEAGGGMTFTNIERLSEVRSCQLLCVPGGYGCITAMEDPDYLHELRRLAAMSSYVTSVCTGSLLLAAAGLLKGRRAACHWAWRNFLSEFSVTPDEARVVRDGSIISGGGVTAGIDMALAVVAEIAGRECAQVVQLALEYAPMPPFSCGRPEAAEPAIVAEITSRFEDGRAERMAAVRRAASRLR